MPDVLYPALHGRQHCPGGEDPIPCLDGEVAHLYAWNYDTSNVIPQNTWHPVANFSGGGGFFEESFVKGETWNLNYETSAITSGIKAEYVFYGWVQFNENAADGEQRMVGFNFGSSDRYITEYGFKTASAAEGGYKLLVVVPRIAPSGLGSGPILEVRHDSGSTRTIRDAQVWCRRHEVIAFGEIATYDPYA